jgi:hypothetical protein
MHKFKIISLNISTPNLKQATMHKRRVYQRQKPKMLSFFGSFHMNRSQQIEVIQLLTVTQDVALDLTGIDPSDKVLHVARDKECRVIDDLGTNTDMALLDESGRLEGH